MESTPSNSQEMRGRGRGTINTLHSSDSSTTNSTSAKSPTTSIYKNDLREQDIPEHVFRKVGRGRGSFATKVSFPGNENFEVKLPNLPLARGRGRIKLGQLNVNTTFIGRGSNVTGSTQIHSPGLPIIPYKYKALNLIPPFDLAFCSTKDFYFIMSAERLNKLYIVPIKNRELDTLTLSDEIQQFQAGAQDLFSRPEVGDVVLAKRNDKEKTTYVRVVVEKLMPEQDGLRVQVREIDKGRNFVQLWSGLKPVNDSIMQLPIIGYYIELNEIPNSSDLIFQWDFESFIKKQRRTKMRVEIVKREESGNYVVNLKRDKTKDLRPDILDLGKWEWEKILELGIYRSDDEILTRGVWSSCPSEFYCPTFPYNVYFEAEVMDKVKLGAKGTEFHGLVTLYLKPITDHTDHLRKVLEAQVDRYMTMVKSSPFFPAINEKSFIQIPDGHPQSGKWLRMIRFDQVRDFYYAVDTHEFFEISPGDMRYQFRLVPPEFTRVPKLIVEAVVLDLDLTDAKVKEAVETTFKRGNKVFVKMVDNPDKEISEDVSIIRSLELSEKLGEIELEKLRSGFTHFNV